MNENSPGIIRNVDEMGRIVIPGNFRKALHIKTGDPLEVGISRESIILKKYSQFHNLEDTCSQVLRAFAKKSNASCIICDTELVIAGRGISISAGARLSDDVKDLITRMESYFFQDGRTIDLLGGNKYPVASIAPVINSGKAFGAVILLRYRDIADWEFHRSEVLADFLSQMIQDAQ